MRTLTALSAIYLVSASAFGVAITLQRNPPMAAAANRLAHMAWSAGQSGARAVNAHAIQPAAAQVYAWNKQFFDRIDPPRTFAAAKPREDVARVVPKTRHIAVAKHEVPRLRPAIVEPPAKVAAAMAPRFAQPPKTAADEAVPRDASAMAPRFAQPPKTAADEAVPRDASAPPAKVAAAAPPAKVAADTAKPAFALAPEKAPAVTVPPPHPDLAMPSPGELTRVMYRLKDNLTREMLQNFELFLYVSKADSGPLAQRMYVFKKQEGGGLNLLYNWPVSTGREQVEFAPNGQRAPSFTPQGYYELDPDRMYKHHTSGQWGAPMPYAMFFNWQVGGQQTGLAIHAAHGSDVALLGSRASAGCVRLAPENAAMLFNLIKTQYRGLAPRFAVDRRTATMSNQGLLMHDEQGRIQLAEGYKVLVFIENYGGDNVVAAVF